MGDTSGSDDDKKNMFVPAEGSQEVKNVGLEVNTPTTPKDPPTSAAVSSASSDQDSDEVEKNTDEQHVEMPPTANNSTQSEEGSNSSPSQNATQQPNQREAAATEGPVTSQYISLSANPSRDDGSASTDTSHSSLLKDFLENSLSQETDVEATATSMPADSMHIRGDGQVEISQHDDAGNLFALEAGNRSVVDIHHANDEGYVEGGEGRASAASLCVIKGEQDDISVLTEAVLLELPESMSEAEDNGWVSFEEKADGGKNEHRMKSPTSTSAFSGSSNKKKKFQRENKDSALCVDLCGIDCFASSTTQWLQAQLQECGGMFPKGVNRVLHTVGLWYQNLVNPSNRTKSSNGDAMKRLADTTQMERKTMREAQSILANTTSVDVTASVEVSDPGDTPENLNIDPIQPDHDIAQEEEPTTAECIVAEEVNGETRDDIVAAAHQEESSQADAEKREDGEGGGEEVLTEGGPTTKVLPKAPVGILKKSEYQPKVNPNAAPSGSESKKKTRRTPKTSNTAPRRTPKSARQYVDTNKKSFGFRASKSPKAVPVPSFKRQKGWTSSKNLPSDYAVVI